MEIAEVRTKELVARPSGGRTPGGRWGEFRCVLIEVESDDGHVGYGEAISRGASGPVIGAVTGLLGPLITGEDPRNIGGLWIRMNHAMRRYGHSTGIIMEAISGIDVALWDLLGKAENRPVWQLLLGAGRREVPAYASAVYMDDVEPMCAQAAEQARQGFDAIKVKIGRGLGLRDQQTDIRALTAIRDVVGDSVELLTDASCIYDVSTAIRMAKKLEDLDVGWFEEPLPPDDLSGYERLRDLTTVPIARGETDYGVFQFHDLVKRRLVDVLQPDIGRCGGITGGRQVADLAYQANLAFSPHTGLSAGLSQLAALHVAAAAPSLHGVEHMFVDLPLKNIFEQPFPSPVSGIVTVPDGPGLGLELNAEAIEDYAVDSGR